MCLNVKRTKECRLMQHKLLWWIWRLKIVNVFCFCFFIFALFQFLLVYYAIITRTCVKIWKSSVFFSSGQEWLLTTTAGTHFCDVFNVVLNFLFMSVMMLMYGVDYVEKTMEIFHKEICRKIKREIYKRLLRFDYIGGRNRVRKLINIMDWIGYDDGEDG